MQKIPRLLARLGLTFCFVSFGVWEIVKPLYWVSYMPELVLKIADPLILVRIHGVILLMVGLMVFFNILRRFAAILAVLIMLEIVVSLLISSGFTEIVVRDIAILFLTFSLMADAWRRN